MVKKILLIDDHVLIRASLVGLLEEIFRDPEIYEAADSAEALLQASAKSIDIVILDLMIPGVSGLLLLPKLKEQLPNAEFVIVTAKDIEEGGELLLNMGVSGVISKSCDLESIRNSLVLYLIKERNKSTASPFSQARTEDGAKSDIQSRRESLFSLSRRQHQILDLMSEGKSNKEIGEILFLAEGTIKNHVSTILNVLEVRNRTEAVFIAKKNGTKF